MDRPRKPTVHGPGSAPGNPPGLADYDPALGASVVTELPVNHRSARPASAVAVEDQLMTMHQSALRIRGVLHLLHETLQSGNGIDAKHAQAVCALIKSAEMDLGAVDKSIEALVDAHLERTRR
ncbi:MAG: hypothetical protein ACKOGN_02550 [Gammaproteobacteria bacterium]